MPIYISTISLVLLFALPFVPKANYSPQALPLLALLLLAQSIYLVKNGKKVSPNYCDLGIGLLALSVLFSFTKALISEGSFPADAKYSIYFLFIAGYFNFRLANIQSLDKKVIRWMSVLLLAFFLTYVGYWGLQLSYSELTVRLSYDEGIGNISQVAMYCSFYLLLIFWSKEDSRYPVYFAVAASFFLAILLQSKLLFLVIALSLCSLFFQQKGKRFKALSLFSACIIALIALLVIQPSSLLGRFSIVQITLANSTWDYMLGLGLGNFNSLINELFFFGKNINTIGELERIAFNDFLQVFLELGLLGLLGLLFISLSLTVFSGKHLYLGFSVLLVACIMFPLQYIESGMLWFFLVLLLSDKEAKIPYFQSIGIKKLTFALSLLSFMLTVYYVGINFYWSKIDRQITNLQTVETVAKYQNLYPFQQSNDQFHFNYGKQLLSLKNTQEALIEFKQAVKINKSYNSVIHLADCYYELNILNKAIYYYEAAEFLRPDNLFPTYKLIYTYNKLGNKEEMKTLYQKVKKYQGPQSPYIEIMLSDLEKLFSD